MLDISTLDIHSLPFVETTSLKMLPPISAIYFVLNPSNEVLYIGQSRNLFQRFLAHHRLTDFKFNSFERICWFTSEEEMLDELEAMAIQHFSPTLNGRIVHVHETTTTSCHFRLGDDDSIILERQSRTLGINKTAVVSLALRALEAQQNMRSAQVPRQKSQQKD
jgi:hypothetical protein